MSAKLKSRTAKKRGKKVAECGAISLTSQVVAGGKVCCCNAVTAGVILEF